MSHCEVYNSFVNSLDRNSQLTQAFIKQIVSQAIHPRSTMELDDDEGIEEELPNNEKIARFLFNSKSFVMRSSTVFLNIMIAAKPHSVVDVMSCIIEKLLNEHSPWYLIVCLFAVLEALVFQEYRDSIRYGYEYSYVASSNSKLIPSLIDVFAIDDWIVRHNGWMALTDNFVPWKVHEKTFPILKAMESVILFM